MYGLFEGVCRPAESLFVVEIVFDRGEVVLEE